MRTFILWAILIASLSDCFAQGKSTPVPIPPVPLEISVPAGTKLKIELSKAINGQDLKTGDKIYFATSEDIIRNGKVILKKGLAVTGTVTDCAPAKFVGTNGKLAFTIDNLILENGSVVPLVASYRKAVDPHKYWYIPLGGFLGKNADFEKGRAFEASLAEPLAF